MLDASKTPGPQAGDNSRTNLEKHIPFQRFAELIYLSDSVEMFQKNGEKTFLPFLRTQVSFNSKSGETYTDSWCR